MDPLPFPIQSDESTPNPRYSYTVEFGFATFNEDIKADKDDVTKKLKKFIAELLQNESNRNAKSIRLALEHYIQTFLPSPPPPIRWMNGSRISVWKGKWNNYIRRNLNYFGVRISIAKQANILLFAHYKDVPSLSTLVTIAVAQKVETKKIMFEDDDYRLKIMLELELELGIPRTLVIEVMKCIDWIQNIENYIDDFDFDYFWMI